MSRDHWAFHRLFQLFTDHLGAKLVSVAIALILWGVVLGSRSVEETKEVPVELVTSPDVVVSNEVPERVFFRLSGPKAFLRTILDRREDPIRINLDGVKPSILTYRLYSDRIRVPIGVKVLAVNPASFQIKLEYLKRKDVPVRAEVRGAPPAGYQFMGVQLKPEVVRVKGPESRVDAVTEVYTKPIDLADAKSGAEKEVALDLLPLGVQLDGPLPKGAVRLDPISANFKVRNVDIRVLTPYKFRIEEKTVTVWVRAKVEDVSSLDRSHVFATVDLRGRGRGRYREPIQVKLPPSVGVVKVVPDHVAVTLY